MMMESSYRKSVVTVSRRHLHVSEEWVCSHYTCILDTDGGSLQYLCYKRVIRKPLQHSTWCCLCSKTTPRLLPPTTKEWAHWKSTLTVSPAALKKPITVWSHLSSDTEWLEQADDRCIHRGTVSVWNDRTGFWHQLHLTLPLTLSGAS